ncbi:MAG: APC family permease [Chryseobacterium sp.]|nr:APC family permease [Chryseobacterium sp.]
MELIIKPFPENTYPKRGILIKSRSPLVWLSEMEFLGIDIDRIKSYVIPSDEPNILYGCLLVFDNLAPTEIGKNSYFQCVNNKLFIPENTIFYPKITQEDWQNIYHDFMVMHPDFGLVKLAQQIDWVSLLQDSQKSNDIIIKASKGVKVPQKIESFTVEMNDEKILEALQKPQTEEEWMKDLPFDLKKVMAGNKKEVEKYLQYLEKYPDRVADLGVPLDVAGTSRGDGWSDFKFGNNWFSGIFGNNRDSSGKGTFGPGWIIFGVLVILSIIRTSFNSNKFEAPGQSAGSLQNTSETYSEPPPPPPPAITMAYRSGVTDIDMKIDSMYGDKRLKLNAELMKASLSFSNTNEKSYKDYLKEGGRPINEIKSDIFSLNEKIDLATDSLKLVYRKKIVKFLAKNETKYKKKIKDSLNKTGSGIPADHGVISMILKKKQLLVEDSLGRLYGTKEYQEPQMYSKKNTKIQTLDRDATSEKDISFLEIIYLILGIVGAVSAYSYFFRKKTLNMGGDNIPVVVKIFLMVILVGMLVYLFYPVIKMYGYNLFTWILIICVVFLLYYLFSEDKTILKSDKDE